MIAATFLTSRRRLCTWRILVHVLTFGVMYACVRTYSKSVYVLFVSSTLGIVFIPSAMTEHSQSAKDIDHKFKFQALREGPQPPKAGTLG